MLGCTIGLWSLLTSRGEFRHAPPAPLAIIPMEQMRSLDPALLEVVADFSLDGRFTKVRSAHLTSFVSSHNAQPDKNPPRLTEWRFYERIAFGDYVNNQRDKMERHLRFRVSNPSGMSIPPERLRLQIETGLDRKQLAFSWVNGSLVSSPFLFVTEDRPPYYVGLTEILNDERKATYHYGLYEVRQPKNQQDAGGNDTSFGN
ncbi:hypothetical protein [Verrucomicrobium sp. BvORR106]|uniref:hypothetical protein n=1 Tax=Verrucomicrobium sp. BvORR106 TaxID=1403819 RepID=UPI002240F850|nr:hypothetical protein [Verrucomicrobium sp. BvORR106]